MLRLGNTSTLAPIVLSFLCSLVSSQVVVAQTPRALVVVTDCSDVEYVRRIGGKLVEVEVLVHGDVPERTDYERCNDRVKRFHGFRSLFYRETAEGSTDRFWRQRLIAANPNGATHRLPSTRRSLDIEGKAERAKSIHDALSETFPNHREQLDENLRVELLRLYSVAIPPLQFALLTE